MIDRCQNRERISRVSAAVVRDGSERPVVSVDVPLGYGRLAQLVARFLHTEEVIGSSPVSPTEHLLIGPRRRPPIPHRMRSAQQLPGRALVEHDVRHEAGRQGSAHAPRLGGAGDHADATGRTADGREIGTAGAGVDGDVG